MTLLLWPVRLAGYAFGTIQCQFWRGQGDAYQADLKRFNTRVYSDWRAIGDT